MGKTRQPATQSPQAPAQVVAQQLARGRDRDRRPRRRDRAAGTGPAVAETAAHTPVAAEVEMGVALAEVIMDIPAARRTWADSSCEQAPDRRRRTAAQRPLDSTPQFTTAKL